MVNNNQLPAFAVNLDWHTDNAPSKIAWRLIRTYKTWPYQIAGTTTVLINTADLTPEMRQHLIAIDNQLRSYQRFLDKLVPVMNITMLVGAIIFLGVRHAV